MSIGYYIFFYFSIIMIEAYFKRREKSNDRETIFERKILARRIIEFKDKHNLYYQELGEAIGVDKSYLNRVVKMVSYMSVQVLIRLAKHMEIILFVQID